MQTSINKDTEKVKRRATIYYSLILHKKDPTETERIKFTTMNHKVPK